MSEQKPVRQKLALVRMPRPEASQALLGLLEALRERALAGEITALAIVSANRESLVLGGVWFDDDRSGEMMMLAELACLQDKLLAEIRVRNGR